MIETIVNPFQWLWMVLCAILAAFLTIICWRWTKRRPGGPLIYLLGLLPIPISLATIFYLALGAFAPGELMLTIWDEASLEMFVSLLLLAVAGVSAALFTARWIARRAKKRNLRSAFK